MGKGIATAVVWGSVAYSSQFLGGWTALVAFFALLATAEIWGN